MKNSWGLLLLLLVLGYMSYSLYTLYHETQPPVAPEEEGGGRGRGGGGAAGEKQQKLDSRVPICRNRLSPTLSLTYHFFLSPRTSLPSLHQLLRSHELKKATNFAYLGSVKERPYSWEGEEERRAAAAADVGLLDRLREKLNFSGKEKADIETLVPERLRTNSTLFLHVRTQDAVTGEETLLGGIYQLSQPVTPSHLRQFKRFLLEDPWGEKLRAATQHLQIPPPAVQSVPEYIHVGPVLEHRPLLTEALLKKFGPRNPFVDWDSQTYTLPVHVNLFISPEDEYLPLVQLPHEAFVVEKTERSRSAAATPIKITYRPAGYASWMFLLHMAQALGSLEDMQFSQYDVSSMKMMMGGSSPWVLLLVYLISVLHLIFEALAFYSDVKFWRSQKNLAQHFSASGVLLDMLLEIITILYLRDNGDSYIVQFFVLLRFLLSVWKLRKLVEFTVSSSPPYLFKIRQSEARRSTAVHAAAETPAAGDAGHASCCAAASEAATLTAAGKAAKRGKAAAAAAGAGEAEDAEAETPTAGAKKSSKGKAEDDELRPAAASSDTRAITNEELQQFENRCMRYLFLLLLPLVIGVSVYELVWVPQKGWYSWLVTSLATCGYAFGFVSMTPQLFRNYKLKSVAHMPWRVLGYQFTNAFIDDVFSCFIRMPRMHRMSVFRDDIVFITFMAQRFMYRHQPPQDEEEEQEKTEKVLLQQQPQAAQLQQQQKQQQQPLLQMHVVDVSKKCA